MVVEMRERATDWLVGKLRDATNGRHEDATQRLMAALRDAVERLDLRLVAWRGEPPPTREPRDTCQPDPLESFDPDQYPVT